MKYGPGAVPEMARKSKSGPGNQKKLEIRKSTMYFHCRFSQGIHFFFFLIEISAQIRDTGDPLAGGYQNPPETRAKPAPKIKTNVSSIFFLILYEKLL